MKILFHIMHKDLLLLMKDKGAFVFTFALPIFLVFVMTYAQDDSFNEEKSQHLSIALANMDEGVLGKSMTDAIYETPLFDVVEVFSSDEHGEKAVRELLNSGEVKIGIVIHEHCSESIKEKVLRQVKKQLPNHLHYQDDALEEEKMKDITIVFDPALNPILKQTIQAQLETYINQIETQLVFISYSQIIASMTGQKVELDSLKWEPSIELEMSYAKGDEKFTILPNSVQHNIPSWMLFALFFICIPMAGNILYERSSGCYKRLLLLPIAPFLNPLSKILVFTCYGCLQALAMILIGLYAMPCVGFPALTMPREYSCLLFFVFLVSFVASSFGYFVGQVSKSYQQSGVLGSIAVMLMSALGGLWIPVFIMPPLMQKLSTLSPLNWGLEGFYELFVRGGSWIEILQPSLLLVIFALGLIAVGYIIEQRYVKKCS